LKRNTFVINIFMTITNVKLLKERLKYARELRGLTQEQLAKKADCAQSAIGNVESGERKNLRNLVLVARVLRVSVDWLFDGGGPKPTKDTFWVPANGQLMAAEPALNLFSPTKYDAWTLDAIGIFSKLSEPDRGAAVARLREFVQQLGPPRNGQTLPMAVKNGAAT
jgi:transcriptional regulator with XRE-family HTH domain